MRIKLPDLVERTELTENDIVPVGRTGERLRRCSIATLRQAVGGVSSDSAAIDTTGLKLKADDGEWYYLGLTITDGVPTLSVSETPSQAVMTSQGLKIKADDNSWHFLELVITDGVPTMTFTPAV